MTIEITAANAMRVTSEWPDAVPSVQNLPPNESPARHVFPSFTAMGQKSRCRSARWNVGGVVHPTVWVVAVGVARPGPDRPDPAGAGPPAADDHGGRVWLRRIRDRALVGPGVLG